MRIHIHIMKALNCLFQLTKMERSAQYTLRKREDIRPVETFQVEGTPAKEPQKTQHCAICSTECESLKALRRHTLTHTKERPYNCLQCPMSFKRSDSLKYHKDVVHEKRESAASYCRPCNKLFSRKSSYQRHQRTAHNSDNALEVVKKGSHCDHCFLNERKTYKAEIPRHHIIPHPKQSLHQCLVCWKTFTNCSNHIGHQFDHYVSRQGYPNLKPLIEAMIQCDICLQVLSSKQALQRHTSKLHKSSFAGTAPSS